MQNSTFWIRITSLYGSQTSPCDLCMHNSVISTRNTSLHGSENSPIVLCMQNNVISIRNTSLYGSLLSFVVFECKTAALGPELQVSMGRGPHNGFLHSKQRLYHQNCKSLWFPVLICGFVHLQERHYDQN